MMLLTPRSEVEIVLYDMSKFSNKWQGIDFSKNVSLSWGWQIKALPLPVPFASSDKIRGVTLAV